MLLCSQVSLSQWKTKYLSDTKLDPGLSSEDEAVGLPLHKAVAPEAAGFPGQGNSPDKYLDSGYWGSK